MVVRYRGKLGKMGGGGTAKPPSWFKKAAKFVEQQGQPVKPAPAQNLGQITQEQAANLVYPGNNPEAGTNYWEQPTAAQAQGGLTWEELPGAIQANYRANLLQQTGRGTNRNASLVMNRVRALLTPGRVAYTTYLRNMQNVRGGLKKTGVTPAAPTIDYGGGYGGEYGGGYGYGGGGSSSIPTPDVPRWLAGLYSWRVPD